MSGFATTREERIGQEINAIATKAEADLKPLRAKYLAMKAWPGRPPVPPIYYHRRMEIVLFDAGNKMQAVEDHWLRRPR